MHAGILALASSHKQATFEKVKQDKVTSRPIYSQNTPPPVNHSGGVVAEH